MTDQCPRAFDETLISGHLDGELTQAAEQRVSVHLEDCAQCRGLLVELQTMREATMSTEFSRPADDQWDERPRTAASFLARGTGWVLAVVWLIAVGPLRTVAVLAVVGEPLRTSARIRWFERPRSAILFGGAGPHHWRGPIPTGRLRDDCRSPTTRSSAKRS